MAPHPDPADGDRARPTHSIRSAGRPNPIVAAVGVAAALAAIGLGTAALVRAPGPAPTGPRSLQAITVTAPPAVALPLGGPDILALLDRRPDLGPLHDPQRQASCLTGLGYPASTRILGAQPIEVGGRPAVLLVLPGEQTGTVVGLAVAPHCSSVDTGLVADTTIRRP